LGSILSQAGDKKDVVTGREIDTNASVSGRLFQETKADDDKA